MDCPIIFLDIDGVLNRHLWNELAKSLSIESTSIAHLNRIIAETGAKIVISSAWRYMIIGQAMTLQGFDYLLRTHGLQADTLIGYTCSDEETVVRGMQIHQWREQNSHIGSYVVIDDMDLWISEMHPMILTNPAEGLTGKHADEAIAILKCPAPDEPPGDAS